MKFSDSGLNNARAFVCPYPDIIIQILIYASHFIIPASCTVTGSCTKFFALLSLMERILNHYGHGLHITYHSPISNSPDVITDKPRYICRIIMRKVTGFFIEIFNSFPISCHPQISISSGNNIGYVIRNDTFRHSLIMPGRM